MKSVVSHAHHWIIDSPTGRTSPGRCRACGEEREFPNVYALDEPGGPRVKQAHRTRPLVGPRREMPGRAE